MQREYHGSRTFNWLQDAICFGAQVQLSFFLRADSHFLRVIFLNTPSLRCHIFLLLALTACTLLIVFLLFTRDQCMQASTTNKYTWDTSTQETSACKQVQLIFATHNSQPGSQSDPYDIHSSSFHYSFKYICAICRRKCSTSFIWKVQRRSKSNSTYSIPF